MDDKTIQAEQLAIRVSIISIIINIILAIGKLAAGILANSAAMVSDAIHSASDVFSTFIVIVGVKISSKASDSDHQYGHERLECVAALILALVLAFTGLGLGYVGVKKIFYAAPGELVIPGSLALIAAIVSIIVKEAMYWYTKEAAEKINSGALMADAWHHRSDALSSIGSFVGILGARLGFPILDSLASVVICLMIVYAAYNIFMDAIDKMVDHSCDQCTIDTMAELIEAQPGVDHIDVLQTRQFGSRIYVDVEVSADDNLSLLEAHAIAENIHQAIESKFPEVKHCMVHVNPCSEAHHD